MRKSAAEDLRRRELAKIHILKKDLGWSDDLYRDVLFQNHDGAESAKDLDGTGRRELIAYMVEIRDSARRGARSCARTNARPGARETAKQVGMIRGLWAELHQLGIVRNPEARALNRFVERTAGVARAEWLVDVKSANAVIEALKAMRKRGGKLRG